MGLPEMTDPKPDWADDIVCRLSEKATKENWEECDRWEALEKELAQALRDEREACMQSFRKTSAASAKLMQDQLQEIAGLKRELAAIRTRADQEQP